MYSLSNFSQVNMISLGTYIFLAWLRYCCALENLAVFGNASMSSRAFPDKWLASAAVDNNTNQRLEGNSCAVTDFGQRTVSWTVDLRRILAFSNITIYYRDENDGTSLTFRLSGFSIFTSNDPNLPFSTNCYRNNNGEQTNPRPSSIFTAPCNSYGRYISLYKDRSSTCQSLVNMNKCAIFELCEVQVFGCPAQFYGPNCLNRCPSNCLNDICNIDSGLCFDCKIGYNGSRCENPCPHGTFGRNCKESCSGNCLNNVTCNTVDGTCISCSPGWQGPMCKDACGYREYGIDCLRTCDNCLDGGCSAETGICLKGCTDGWTGPYCSSQTGNQLIAVVIVLSVALVIVIAMNVLVKVKSGLCSGRHGNNNNRNQDRNGKGTQPESHGTAEMYENPSTNYDSVVPDVQDPHTYISLHTRSQPH